MEQLLLKLKRLLGDSTFDELVVSRDVIDLKVIFEELVQKGKITSGMYEQVTNIFEK
jgi:hypothetical protein